MLPISAAEASISANFAIYIDIAEGACEAGFWHLGCMIGPPIVGGTSSTMACLCHMLSCDHAVGPWRGPMARVAPKAPKNGVSSPMAKLECFGGINSV